MSQQPTFYWYDYEAFGLNPVTNRLSQFAGVRTDMDLNIVGDPLMMYCKPADDFLPDPTSCLITGITPQKTLKKGVIEAEFIERINKEFSQPGTCVLGYNNLRFDDEYTRHTLYRNLFDPYAREWQNSCSRWDLLDVVRMTRALRPEGVEWPTTHEGRPSVRLEDLTIANNISHESAHDALSDVYATIAVARLIKEKQGKLFEYAFENRSKKKIFSMLNVREQKPVLHISGMYPAEQGNMAVVVPVAQHPTNKNGIIVYDLSVDPSDMLNMKPEKIHERMFTPKEQLPEGVARIPLKTVHANKCPIIAPFMTLDAKAAKRHNIDLNICRTHLDAIKNNPGLSKKLQKVFSETTYEKRTDPDEMLYGGAFFSNEDKLKMAKVHQTDPSELRQEDFSFDDDRLEEMLFRYRARNYPNTLVEDEQIRWQKFRSERLSRNHPNRFTLEQYFAEIERLRQDPESNNKDWAILDKLEAYGMQIAP